MLNRPDPDQLLQRVQDDEARQQRGQLKIFLGAAAGVGKTYAMLESARGRLVEGVDVIIGCVETHGRAETEALLEGLERLPARQLEYRGATLSEFDIDAALLRHPQLILIDELAHSNAPGMRHAKRWQDVEELLNAGIDVYSAVNVQHIESLNDVVAQITNVIVRETIPDHILERADEVELIDLSPDELLQRLREGKVYIPQQAEKAIHHFFRKGNLMALRELALRRTADRVDAQMQRYMQDHAIANTWPTQERLLVCISASPLSMRLVRATQRMSARLHADWLALYVETPAHLHLSNRAKEQLLLTQRLVEKLGAQSITLSGSKVSEEVLHYARQRNVTKIVVGKPNVARWRELLFGSTVEEIIRASGEIDIYVISGEKAAEAKPMLPPITSHSGWRDYLGAVAMVLFCTGVAHLLFPYLELSNLIMLYLLGVTFVSYRSSRGPSILASVLSVAAFDFFFVSPYLTFAVHDVQYLVTFAVMLTVALVISTLTLQIRAQADAARQRERRTATLYEMARNLADTRGLSNLLAVSIQHIDTVFESKSAILLSDDKGIVHFRPESTWHVADEPHEQSTAQWVFAHAQVAGANTDTLPSSQATYVPLVGSRGVVGVLALHPSDPNRLRDPEQLHLLQTFANLASLAIERAYLAREAHQASVQIETEQLRNSLLSSVSHDLRTPLASITGAATSLQEDGETLTAANRHELAATIAEESERLNQLVMNLLEMTKLESGAVQVKKEWQPLEEVIGVALTRLKQRLRDRPLTVHLPPDLPLVPLDTVLIEQVLINLLENAHRYTPPGTAIEISAETIHEAAGTDETALTANIPNAVIVHVADHGAGIPNELLDQIFDRFFRLPPNQSLHGSGLGLTICRGMIQAHGGRIWAENRQDGSGAIFSFMLPLV